MKRLFKILGGLSCIVLIAACQLVDIKKRKLEMDFVLQGDRHSMHILNAVSPAFTCSLPFSEYVGQQIGATLT